MEPIVGSYIFHLILHEIIRNHHTIFSTLLYFLTLLLQTHAAHNNRIVAIIFFLNNISWKKFQKSIFILQNFQNLSWNVALQNSGSHHHLWLRSLSWNKFAGSYICDCLDTFVKDPVSGDCVCADGFENKDGACVDIDECANSPCGENEAGFYQF